MFTKKTTVMGLSALAILSGSIDTANARRMLMPQPEAIMSKVTDTKAMDDMMSTRDIRLKKCPNGLMVEYQYNCYTTYYKFCDDKKEKVCTANIKKARTKGLGGMIVETKPAENVEEMMVETQPAEDLREMMVETQPAEDLGEMMIETQPAEDLGEMMVERQ